MPILHRSGNWKIVSCFNEHNPPHVHIRSPDYDLTYDLILDTCSGSQREQSKAADAIEWIRRNKHLAMDAWRRQARIPTPGGLSTPEK